MDYPGSRPVGRAVRQRVLDLLDASAPLTIIEGVPGSGKQALVRQRYEQLQQRENEAGGASNVFLIEFPQRALGDAPALSHAAGQFAEALGGRGEHVRNDAWLDALMRGRVDLSQLERDLPELTIGWRGMQLCLVNYEWQASPLLDRLIIAAVGSGIDVLCSLVDASDLRAAASVAGVATSVITDDQLVFTSDEIGMLAASFGLEPEPQLIERAHELTAGHALATSMLLLRALGVERMINEGEQVRIVIDGQERDWRQTIDLRAPSPRAEPSLRRLDPARLTLPLLRSAGGMLSYAAVSFVELLATDQGRSPFIRAMGDLVTVSSLDLDALASVLPDGLRIVERLRRAGYARIEYLPGSAGVVHWHEGMRTVLLDWLRGLPLAEPVGTGSGFVLRMVSWLGEHGRPQEAAQLLQDLGDVDVLEGFAASHLIDMVWTRKVRGFTPVLALPDAQRAQLPTVTVLAALETYRTIGQDQELVRRALSIFPTLEERSRQGTALQRVNSALSLCVGCAALDMWESYGDALLACADAVAAASLAGHLNGRLASRADLIVGVNAMIRGDLDLAKTLLLRALAEGVDTQGRAVAVLCLRVLEGYFGQRLIAVETQAHEAERLGDALASAGDIASWGEVEPFLALARAWQAVWAGDHLHGLAVLREAVKDNDRLLTQPFLAWSYTLLLLLDGQAEAAYGVWREVARRIGGNAPMSGRRLLGMTLAAFASGRSAEAMALADRHADRSTPLGVMVLALVAFSTGQQIDHDELIAGISTSIVPRARTLLQVLTAGRYLHMGEQQQAVALLLGLEASSPLKDVELALRFAPRVDVEAMRDRLDGRLPAALSALIERMVDVPHVLVSPCPRPQLTPAERQVLDLLAQGLSNKAIAEQLFLSVNTIKSHLRAVYRKLEVNSRDEAQAAARLLSE